MALKEATLKECFGSLDEYIFFKNKKQTFEEARRFWNDMTNDTDKLTAFMISIICRVITVDSVPSDTTLPDIYDALIMKCDTKANFEAWTTALVKEKEKDKKHKAALFQPDPKEIVLLRSKLLLTLHFIVSFYQDYNIGQIATLITRWRVAREGKLLEFEQKTIALFGIDSDQDMLKKLRKGSIEQGKSKNTSKQIDNLIKQCIEKLRRGLRDQFPLFSPSLCVTSPVSDSLSYIKLLSVLDKNPVNYVSALNLILHSLSDITEEQLRLINTGQPANRFEEKEHLLPYLQLFKELVTRAPSISTNLLDQAYKTIYPFFLWPVPYCRFANNILNFIDAERICSGFAYRNRMLSEHNIQVKDSTINIYERIYLLIDYAAPQALSFREVFKKSEPNDSAVKIHVLKRAFVAIKGVNIDVPSLDRILKVANKETIDIWLSEMINTTHEVLWAGQLDSQDILDKHVTGLLKKMVEFYNEKNPEDKIESLSEITENPCSIPFTCLDIDGLPDIPISVKFLNSLMEPKSPEDIMDEILTDGGANIRNPTGGRIKRNRISMVESPSMGSINAKESLEEAFHRTNSDGKLDLPRQSTISKVKDFVNKKRNESKDRPSIDDEMPEDLPEASDEVDDEMIFVDIFGNIASAKQDMAPKTKRGILAKELRDGRAVLKLVIAGDDNSVAMIIKTYLHVKMKHSMSDIDVVFYYIPLSNAETISEGEGQLASTIDMTELQFPLTKYFYENQPSRGGDVWMGRLLGHLDGWYENFVTLPIQCALHLFPQFSLNVDDSGDPEKNRLRRKRDPKATSLLPSPMKIIRDTVVNFTREATRPVIIRNYYIEMVDIKGKHTDSVMCHRLELITRDPNQKTTQVGTIPKPASVRLTLHAIQLDGTPYPQVEVPFQRYFALKASNIPKPGDYWAANPSESGFQVHAVVSEKVGGGGPMSKSRYGPSDQQYSWYVKQLTIEAAEKDSFYVSIDKDNPHSNISHLMIRPTRMDRKTMEQAPPQFLDDLAVPFMTYWPVDL